MSETPTYAPLPDAPPAGEAEVCASDCRGPGRPREYDHAAAVDAITAVFRAKGFEAASVEDLTRAAGLSRSSFYNGFGSKRGALLAALDCHAARHRRRLLAEAEAQPDPAARLRAMIDAHFAAEVSRSGCFVGDAMAELGARDPEVTDLAAGHARRLIADFARLSAPFLGEAAALPRARAAYALTLGAGLMRKSGAPPETVDGLRLEAHRLLGID